MLLVVPDEEFLHTKINNKDIYADYGATEDMHAVSGGSIMDQGWRFDSIAIKLK